MGKSHHWHTSDHFNGTRFHNPVPRTQGFVDFLRWMATRKQGSWPEITSNTYAPAPPVRVDDLRITFIGHTTVLIQMDRLNILTDPIWSLRASPLSFVGPRRRAMPGIRFEDLPPIDLVLLSHDHYDHFDVPTIERLNRAHSPSFIVPLGLDARLSGIGPVRSTALDWWNTCKVAPNFTVTAVPARHFSGRSPFDRDTTLWCGFVLRGSAGCVYFAGDTGFGDHFRQIADRVSPIRAALLPIGAFRPEWFMNEVHCTPAQAVEAHGILKPVISVATHFGAFPLADDGQEEPVFELQQALAAAGDDSGSFWVLTTGEGRDVPKSSSD